MTTLTRKPRRFIAAIALSLAGLMAVTGDPAAAACYPPGDHWYYDTSAHRAWWDWNGWTTCVTIGNPNWCSRKYVVTHYLKDHSGAWRYWYTETRTLRCNWYD